ncbi:phage tail protein [Hahella ganghwensis]|uniref:phage tail-collar fiber domain-containing protein n=1 Tax=Hahella ganghwensis TaxID=286420 RepID=UPI00037316C6|nr:phage tail protein [Hahella ganghwensis]
MPAILNAGRDLIAQKQGAGEALIIDRFVLAYIDHLDPTQPVDLNTTLPNPDTIVWQGPVTRHGYVSPDQVVYSLLLGANVGDFDYNWIGLLAEDDTLVAVATTEPQHKRKSDGFVLGNTLTRNFLLAFTDAQATTQININAHTWQIDFTARLDGIDERERQSNVDLYGDQAFMGEGFQVWNDSGVFKLKAGWGYVGGLRITQGSEITLTPGVLPKDVWLDVSLQGNATDVVPEVQVILSTDPQANYQDVNQRQHYLVKIAQIAADGLVTDLRKVLGDQGPAWDLLLKMADVVNHLTSEDPHKPLSAAQGKALLAHIQQKLGIEDQAADAAKLAGIEADRYQRITDAIDAGRVVNVPAAWTDNVTLSDSVTSTASHVAASSQAVKTAYDKAKAALPINGKAADSDKVDGYHASALVKHSDQTSKNSSNGYLKLSMGIMIQWGKVSTASDSPVRFSFPTAFRSSCYQVVGNRIDRDHTKEVPIVTWSRTSFEIDRAPSVDNTCAVSYIAIGR